MGTTGRGPPTEMEWSGEGPGRPRRGGEDPRGDGSTQRIAIDPRVTVVSPECSSADNSLEGTLEPGEIVGRYVILNLVGQGGMGVVYTAYDPELDRKIALKLLLTTDPDSGARLQREAQAMAKLSHPNVVTIHDVGAHEDQVYLAMEFVNGLTLDAWLKRHTPPWTTILEIFLAVGEGLAAAHAAGLVHRDVKPENIMIGDDGRVRVMDFGLARADQPAPLAFTGKHPSLALLTRSSILSSELTQEGHLVGTPLYMAPEQWLGLPTDARSDLFSFAIALWEAIYGVHPFPSESTAGVAVAITEGLLRPPPPRSTVPPWLRRVLTRGLANKPEDRWPTMRAFVDALRDDPAPRVRKLLFGGLALATALAFFVSWHLDRSRQARECERTGASIASVWSPTIAEDAKRSMLKTEVGFAPATTTSTLGMLDDYASAWSTTREETCVAGIRGGPSPELQRRVDACLDDRRDALEALVASLRDADAGTVEGAVNAVASLQQPETCADEGRLGAYEELPEHLEADARALLQQLATIHALTRASRFDEATDAAEAAKIDAAETRLALLEIRAGMTAGEVAESRGDYPAARQEYETALFAAGRSGADELAADASLSLAWISGVRLAEYDLGRSYARLGQMWLERLGAPPTDLRWHRYHHVLGSLFDEQADYEQARDHQEKAIAIAEAALGPSHPQVSTSVNNLGLIFRSLGEPKVARGHFRRAVEIREKTYGPDHPDVAAVLANLGNAETDLGNFDAAMKHLTRTLEIRERCFGPDHLEVASTLLNIARVTYERGDHDAALRDNSRALAIQERELGPDHPRVTTNLFNIGVLKGELGDYDGAEAALSQTLARQLSTLDADHPRIGISYVALAEVAIERRDYGAARAQVERALPILAALGPEHPHYGSALTVFSDALLGLGEAQAAADEGRRALTIFEGKLGEHHHRLRGPLITLAAAQLALGDYDGAIKGAERALALVQESPGSARVEARARFVLAKGRWRDPATRPEALTSALEAQRLAQSVGEGAATLCADIDAWLEGHSKV